jgi:hypothetical protein
VFRAGRREGHERKIYGGDGMAGIAKVKY